VSENCFRIKVKTNEEDYESIKYMDYVDYEDMIKDFVDMLNDWKEGTFIDGECIIEPYHVYKEESFDYLPNQPLLLIKMRNSEGYIELKSELIHYLEASYLSDQKEEAKYITKFGYSVFASVNK
jgi:hypothetical protein